MVDIRSQPFTTVASPGGAPKMVCKSGITAAGDWEEVASMRREANWLAGTVVGLKLG